MINYKNDVDKLDLEKENWVLVTGAAGFIGSHLCDKLLEEDFHVLAIDDLSFGSLSNLQLDHKKLKFFEVDIRNKSEISKIVLEHKPSQIFHLAANASVPLSTNEPEFDFEINALGTVNLLEIMRNHLPEVRMILASSAAVYGEPGKASITEETALKPISQYGLSKLIAEMQGCHYHSVYGVPVVIARLFNSYGPRMPRFVILDFMRKLKKDPSSLEILGNGSQTRDFTYVSDTVSGLIHCARFGQTAQAYNIASGTATSVTELAVNLINVLGLNAQTKISYTGQSWGGDAQFWSVRIDRIIGLGYKPKVDLAAGLAEVVKWFNTKN